MSFTQDFEKKYKIGYPILEQLFKLSDKDLKIKLKSIIGNMLDERNSDLFDSSAGVTKTIHNEKCKEIIIEWYDWIEISAFGISFCPEHGPSRQIIEFNQHFVL